MNERFKVDVRYLGHIYDPNHDLFDDPVQMNHIDKRLLDLIVNLEKRVQELENTTKKMNPVFCPECENIADKIEPDVYHCKICNFYFTPGYE